MKRTLLALALIGCSGGNSDSNPPVGVTPSKSLAGTAAIGDACGPKLHVTVGADDSCTTAAGSEPHVRFLTNSGETGKIAAGQSWTSGDASPNGFNYVHFYRSGAGGNRESATSASLSILEVTGATARVRYAFTTADGERYEGEAASALCPSTPNCP